jgi:F-type H+-transporting ATPase subunit a
MQELGITHFFNFVFGPFLAWLMQLVGFHPMRPNAPINDAFALEMLVAFGLIAFFIIVRLTLSVDNPGTVQHVAEMVHEFVANLGEQVVGHDSGRFVSFATCVLLFVLLNNLLGLLTGLIHGLVTPTGQPVVPLGIALMTFIYYNFHGMRVQGPWNYIKHIAGPLPWLAPLMFPIELVSHFARIMSLTIRLYANMFASDLLTLVWFSLIPLAVPSIFLGLHFAVSLIQAFVFMLLTFIYLAMAVEEAH